MEETFETEMEDLFLHTVAFSILTAILIFILKKVPRKTKGENVLHHIGYLLFVGMTLWFCPEFIQNVLFSQLGVVLIGSIIPIYESIMAVLSINESDDVAWLQYWIISGIFAYCTEWMDVIAEIYPSIAEHWYEFEFFTILWILLPNTDGSALLFTKVTEPLFAPIANSIKERVESKLTIFFIILNSSYLWIIWFTFLTLDEEARRFIVIAVGTLYPIAASTIACSTSESSKSTSSYDKGHDDTFWLTYWICFSILFLMMDYLENFVGSIRGFYSICLCITIYLFLPMFKGADAVFRNILVPLSGQYEKLLLRDIYLVKLELEEKIPEQRREAAFGKAAALFKSKEE